TAAGSRASLERSREGPSAASNAEDARDAEENGRQAISCRAGTDAGIHAEVCLRRAHSLVTAPVRSSRKDFFCVLCIVCGDNRRSWQAKTLAGERTREPAAPGHRRLHPG